MKMMMSFAMVFALIAMACAQEKIEKINPQLLIGKWQGEHEHQGSMEFTKDGKYKMTDGQGKVTEMS